MAPPPQTIIEDEEEFLKDVEAFARKRGIPFDREGKVSGRPVSLYKLYKLVMAKGGYDKLSAERMQWRTLVKEFGFGKTHEAVMTFQLKTVYYKNLAAYEIATYWAEEPPPKEILEDLSAKGGDLRNRTLDNFPHAGSQQAQDSIMVDQAESATEEHTTPKREKSEPEEPGSGSRNPIRQLRHEPKRTQMFQPDTSSTRARNVRATDSPATPSVSQHVYSHGSADPRNPAFDWYDKYEPRPPNPLTLRSVHTPATNSEMFYQRKAVEKAKRMPRLPLEPQQLLKMILPPGQMSGPNIYLRCLYGLRSGIPAQQEFALHHLVKVSFERGDKYKFEGFPFLAESLLEKALEITELIYGTKWEVSYDEVAQTPVNSLNAAYGTQNLLDRIKSFPPILSGDDLESAELTQRLERLNEASLVLRNMVMLEDNAMFLSRFPLFKDFLTIAITLPDQPRLTEYRRYALEIAEQVTRYWPMDSSSSLYQALTPLLESNDRGVIISTLRSLNRMGIDTPDIHRLTNIPLSTIERMFSLSLLDSDNELLENTLDFIYEYTAIPENNTELLTKKPHLIPSIIPRLAKLMSYQAYPKTEKVLAPPTAARRPPIPPTIPAIPNDLHAQLLQIPEPKRSTEWLKCCFEESASDDITQIAIWQAYQSRFANNGSIPAAEFIKGVSHTFKTAQAQVINGPQPRFIIKGIKPKRILVDIKGNPYFKCLWEIGRQDPYDRLSQRHMCNQWLFNREQLWTHIMHDHLQIPRTVNGRFSNEAQGPWTCHWTSCTRQHALTKPNEAGSHIRVHIPPTAEAMSDVIREMANEGKEQDREVGGTEHVFQYTMMDSSLQPCGPPWMSVLILRNLARYANKHGQPFEKQGVPLVEQLFGGYMYVLFSTIGTNRTLREQIIDLLHMIERGARDKENGLKRGHEEDQGVAER